MPLGGVAEKAYSVSPVLAVGLATAQMIAVPDLRPFEETTVNPPESCTLAGIAELEAPATRCGAGPVTTSQT